MNENDHLIYNLKELLFKQLPVIFNVIHFQSIQHHPFAPHLEADLLTNEMSSQKWPMRSRLYVGATGQFLNTTNPSESENQGPSSSTSQ